MDFALNYRKKQLDEIRQLPQQWLSLVDSLECQLDISAYVTPEPVTFAEHLKGEYVQFKVGESWGQLFDCGWFKLRGQLAVSEAKETSTPAYFLKLDLSGEALLYDDTGHALKGFTNGSSVFSRTHGEPGKQYYDISRFVQTDGRVELTVEAGCNDLFGELQDNGELVEACIVTRDVELLALYYDLESLVFLLESFTPETAEYEQLFADLYRVYLLLAYQDRELVTKARTICETYITGQCDDSFTFSAIGHAHIDLAWLWPIRETKRKAARSLANVFYLLEQYADFTFGISQPQLVEWLRAQYPDLFARLKHYVDCGRIEIQGGAWVEMDTNVPDEESLVRQMLYGTRYWQEVFGKRANSLWLPDVFGYNANLPQIIKKSGMDYFMTTKMSWCLRNAFPHNTFYFEGVDGSRVLTHMPPEGTYNSAVHVQKLKKARRYYREHEISDQALVLFGIGDGGGGPGDEHMERIRRNNQIPSSPRVEVRTSAEFFERLDQPDAGYPTWRGELYLENHQGTYTSQGNVKRYNQLLETKLKLVEQLMVVTGAPQFKPHVDVLWKEVLLYQFHDILPGSSIKRVYDECLARYQQLDTALDELLHQLLPGAYSLRPEADSGFYNPLSQAVTIPFKTGDSYHVVRVASLSSTVLSRHSFPGRSLPCPACIETSRLRVSFDPHSGFIRQLIHKPSGHDCLRGQGNELLVYCDLGNAWDIADHYRQQVPEPLQLVGQSYICFGAGELHEVVNEYRFKRSTVRETVLIREDSDVVDIRHDVDWQDVGYMLRSRFEPTVVADEATFDIQFGHYRRSRRNDTLREQAQFEVCGQQWVDVRDDKSGFALLTCGKYGHYIKGDTLDINLLRSTDYPCAGGDIGQTSYRYGILAHDGRLSYGAVDEQAKQLNTFFPVLKPSVELACCVELESDVAASIEVSAVKYAYDDEAVIVRLYEKQGGHHQACLRLSQSFSRIEEVNLVEQPLVDASNLTIEQGRVALSFKPFEVRTFKLYS